MKIGVLYPRSKAHPGMMVDFMDGMKTALTHCKLNNMVQLATESIGFGGHEKEVYEKAEKLLILEGADILVAYIDLKVISLLEPLLYATGKLMIVVNPGANYPGNWVSQPNIIYLTLHHSFLCWLTGGLAAKNGNANAAMATSFYDCGYLHTAAITNGFMNKGGQIRYNYINNNLYNDTFEIKQLTDFLSSDKETENLLCVFDEQPATLFYERLNKYDAAGGLHLFVSPMMLESTAWEGAESGYRFSMEGYLPYHASSENEPDLEFRNIIKAQTKKEASIFSLLGWETALILQEVFNNHKGNPAEGVSIKDHLTTTVINGPRGELRLDEDTNYFRSPVYKAVLKNNSNKILVSPSGHIDNEWESFVAKPVEGPSSGWTNTYLCY